MKAIKSNKKFKKEGTHDEEQGTETYFNSFNHEYLAFAACGNTDMVMESEPMETVETAESTETSTLEKESGDGKTESAAKADGTEVLPVTEVSASVTEKTEAESTVDIRQTVS